MNLEESQLIERVQAGDESAFEQIYYTFAKQIYFLAYRFFRNQQDAEDILQETFIRLFSILKTSKPKKRKSDSSIKNLSTYLYRIAINLCIDRSRANSKMQPQLFSQQGSKYSYNKEEINHVTPANNAILNEQREIIYRALDSLSEKERLFLLLHEVEDLKIREIALIFNRSEGTVKATLYRAHHKLREKLIPFFSELTGEAATRIESESKVSIDKSALSTEKTARQYTQETQEVRVQNLKIKTKN